jgi:hypothetical protein
MINDKLIYNTYLKISRTQSGMPFRFRKQWEGFEESHVYPHVLRLKNFFSRNRNVDINDFFSAPYTVYPGESGFDLSFYSSPKAIKVYTLAVRKKMLLSPDDNYHLNSIAKGLKFIQTFCYNSKIYVDDYPKFKDGVQSMFITHLKEKKISIYNLFAFNNFEKYLAENDPDLLRFTLGELYDNIPVFRTKYLGSKSAKLLASSGLIKIKRNLA